MVNDLANDIADGLTIVVAFLRLDAFAIVLREVATGVLVLD